MADFPLAIQKVLRHEGVAFDPEGQPTPGCTGYSDHADDPGKVTNYGITELVARENLYTGPMADIPYWKVLDIYRTRYWERMRGNEIPDQQVAEEILDTGANCGMFAVGEFLQRTLNALNLKGKLYPDITVDGAMGPRTIGTLNKALTVTSYHRLCILRALDALQCVHYINLTEENEKFESFVPGWLRNRVGVKDDV